MIDRLATIFGGVAKALEILYVIEGIKPVARQGFYEHELPRIRRFCQANNLFLQTSPYKVILVDVKTGEYSNKGVKASIQDDRRGMFFVYISKDEEKAALANCYEVKNNHAQLGNILGYPKCCVEFFARNEPKYSRLDNDYVLPCLENSEGNKFPFQNNILMRNRDIALLSHFPCSFNCGASVDLANAYLEIIRKYNPHLAETFENELKCFQTLYRRMVKFV